MKSVFENSVTDCSVRLLGIIINPLSIAELHVLITQAISSNQRWIVAHHNLHSIYLYHHDVEMRAFYAKANYTHVDGMALVFLGKLLGLPLRRQHRVTYADWFAPLISEVARQGWRVFYLGSKPGVAEQGAKILQQRFPNLQIETAHGYFNPHSDSQENLAVLEVINTFQPHILMVGMGMPRQERWILHNLESIQAHTILPCGACMDYVAGAIPTPPRWAGRCGLEWLFRLLAEPGRLWRRYLVEPWFLLRWILADRFQQQKLVD